MKKIAIFGSGSGTNAENIASYFKDCEGIKISLFLSNNKDAYILERAKKLNIKSVCFNNEQLNSDYVINILKSNEIDFIVLAGFLRLMPEKIVKEYPHKIVNIHPALLPKYGGRGMYGERVHKMVLQNKETESGITIHYVNEKYDAGDIIFQAKCDIIDTETQESLAEKIHKLEYKHFPEVIEKLILKYMESEINIINISTAFKLPISIEAYKMYSSATLEIINIQLHPGESIPLHSNNIDVVFYVLEGEGIFTLNDKSQKITANSCVEVTKNNLRAWRNESAGKLKMLVLKKT